MQSLEIIQGLLTEEIKRPQPSGCKDSLKDALHEVEMEINGLRFPTEAEEEN
jgi:hypothetical protein